VLDYTGKTILSILIPSIPERQDQYVELMAEVWDQIWSMNETHPTLGNVEIVADHDKAFLDGGPSIGKKRGSLVNRAKGKYMCFLDDDEDISPNYVECLVRMCHENQDVVTFRSFCVNDFYWTLVDMSLMNPTNEEATPERIVKRRPWHICPVRSEYAKKYPFEDINYGEDWKWFEKVLKHCHTEAHTSEILHSYQHSSKTSEADRIIKQTENERA